MNATKEWCFVQDANGEYYITDASPSYLEKGRCSWGSEYAIVWYRVIEDENGNWVLQAPHGLAKYINFNELPFPKWEDPHPLIIVQHITQTYYTID